MKFLQRLLPLAVAFLPMTCALSDPEMIQSVELNSDPKPPSLIYNDPVGGSGGKDFSVIGAASETIDTLHIWVGDGAGQPKVLRGLQITWSDNQKSTVYGTTTDDYQSFKFAPGETIKEMQISGGIRADSISFTTTSRSFFAGGQGGKKAPMNVGSGILVGFQGGAARDIDRLGPIFAQVQGATTLKVGQAFALAWVREMGIEMRFHRDKQSFVFMRQLDLVRDVLYIPFDKVDEFIQEPLDRQFEPDLFARMVGWHPNVKHIAVPEALLQSDSAALREIFDLFYHPKTFFIVVDAQPDWHESNMRWELDSMQGRGFFWNSEHGRFVGGIGLSIGDEALYQRIERAIDDLASLFTPSHLMDDFEIRPVFVIRK
ncbi:hypothetical protein BDV34DRAFT_211361 [Aspergillus parasiticus]|uniref:Jacalin-type lectin domain-containing protein n=1 Tax=Aspergillus parasiticus TaxID=5067 RepID=A0A5N6DS93_ASPPA|nr:hypothetical protein BDV34DRAFT_211361 [Aspergillus parasiticus]